MKTSHLLTVLQEANLSPESLAERLGISGMTVRRWQQASSVKPLPKLYATALTQVIRDLLVEGKLSLESKSAQLITDGSSWAPFSAAANHLGITFSMLNKDRFNSEALMDSLSQIGEDADHRDSVTQGKVQIFSFKELSAGWKQRITSLWTVLNSKDLMRMDKLVAYGALFYLLTPFDLIPDTIPVFGYIDDYAILGLAAAYYLRHFPKIFE